MKHPKIKIILIYTILINFGYSCKQSYLDAKPSSNILSPSSLAEYQNLLDHPTLNQGIGLGILASDEYQYSSYATWLAINSTAKNSYIWAKDLYEGTSDQHWASSYFGIFYANNVLKGLEKIKKNTLNTNEWNKTKGWALFIRAFNFYESVNNFCQFYDKNHASTDLGIPLRLNSSIDEILPRSSVQDAFDQIFTDLNEASLLLPSELPTARTRPSKVAVHALLSRIYLNMREYEKSELHADICLSLYNKLIDYNNISKTSTSPFGYNHDEQIYAKQALSNAGYSSNGANPSTDISPELIALYEPNDLRIVIFYAKQNNETYDAKRSYYGSANAPFIGLATDEIYLIKSECLARRGELDLSMSYLNQLRIKRWDNKATIPYKNLTAATPKDALEKVLLERRRELVLRSTRWDDIRRLNKESANITLKRNLNGITYLLPPNDPKYVFPIPDNEIALSGIQQNPR